MLYFEPLAGLIKLSSRFLLITLFPPSTLESESALSCRAETVADFLPAKTVEFILISVVTLASVVSSLAVEVVALSTESIEVVILSLTPRSVVSTYLLLPSMPGAETEASGLDRSRVEAKEEAAVLMASRAASCAALA